MRNLRTIALVLFGALLLAAAPAARAQDPLPSWNAGAAKTSIVEFVGRVTKDGGVQWTAGGAGARLCLYVHHTDAAREWAYDRKSSIGRLDKGLDEAQARKWTVVDMQRDWAVIFPFDKK